MKRPTGIGLAALAASVPLLGGCGLSPMTTLVPYQPANGINTSVGQLQARDLLIVGSSVGKPGVVSGVLFNSQGPAVTVELSLAGGGAPVSVSVPAGDSVRLGAAGGSAAGGGAAGGGATSTPGAQVSAVAQFPSLPQPAGAVVVLQLRTSSGARTSVQVPVLPPTFEYSTITPSAEPSMTPYPAATTSPGATATPGATAKAGATATSSATTG